MEGIPNSAAKVMQKCPFAKHAGLVAIKNVPSLIQRFGHMCSFLGNLEKELSEKELEDVMKGIVPPPKAGDAEAKPGGGGEGQGCPFRQYFDRLRPYHGAIPPASAEILETHLAKLKNEGNYREFINIERNAANFPKAFKRTHKNAQGVALDADEGEEVTVWCSNDYLGMGVHPRVIKCVREAVLKGTGAGGTRNISGTSHHITQLEAKIAQVHGKDAALVFGSGYIANQATLSTLPKLLPGCEIFSDAHNHASMIEGIRHSKCPKHIWRHNDTEHLEELLAKSNPETPKVIAFESVYSMDGDIAPILDLGQLAKKYNALTYIDEVHAIGMYGRQGAGICERDGLSQYMTIVSGTLGKAVGNYGGYIAGPLNVIDAIRCFAPSFIFTTALPPHVAAGANEAFTILGSEEGEELRQGQQNSARHLKLRLAQEGFPVIWSQSHIVPVIIGDSVLCKKASDILMSKHKIYVQPINYPTVPKGTERFRLTPGPHHTTQLIDELVTALASVWDELKIPMPTCNLEGMADVHMHLEEYEQQRRLQQLE